MVYVYGAVWGLLKQGRHDAGISQVQYQRLLVCDACGLQDV